VRALDPPDGCCDPLTGELITADGIRRGLVARVEARVLPKAGARSLRQHRDAIARAVAGVAPRTAEQRHQDASERRRVEFRSEADGMAWLSVYGPAVDLMAVKVMLDAAAEAAKTINPDDPRTYDQIRVDTLTELAWAILETGHLPDFADDGDRCAEYADSGDPNADSQQPTGDTTPAGRDDRSGADAGGGLNRAQRRRLRRRNGRAAAVHVIVPLSTLIGEDEQPGELEGYGPITAETAQRIAAHGVWRRMLTDPASGMLLDYGTTRYTPPVDLLDHVHARDQTCRFPTCARPARLCQFDHTIAAGRPGWSTSDRNGGPLSAGCHNGKTHAGWQLSQPEPGRFLWTAPTGHTYRVEPEDIGPITVTSADPDPPIDYVEPEWTTVPDPPPF
jgi:hypothetical protein